MAVSVVGVAQKSDQVPSGSPLSLSTPAGTAAGDCLLAFISGDADAALSACGLPSGFTQKASFGASGTRPRGRIGYWQLTSTPPASHSFAHSGSSIYNVMLVTLRGQKTGDPFVDSGSYTEDTVQGGTNHAAGELIGTVAGDWLFGHWVTDHGASATINYTAVPSGMTETVKSVNSEWVGALVAHLQIAGGGATGAKTAVRNRSTGRGQACRLFVIGASGAAAAPQTVAFGQATRTAVAMAFGAPDAPMPPGETPALPAPVTRSEREAMLSASTVECWLDRLEVLDENDMVQRDIVARCTALRVRHDGFDQVHRSVDFEIDVELDWGRERVSPWIHVSGGGFADTVQMGVFCITKRVPSREGTPSSYQVTGLDKGYLLHHALRRAVSYPKAAPILAAVVDLLFQRNVDRTQIDPARGGRLFKEARTWAVADQLTYLEVVNQLLEMVSYRALSFTADGRAHASPLVSPAHAPVVWRYDTEDVTGLVHPEGGSLEDNLLEAFNDWSLWAQDQEREDPPVPGDGLYTATNQLDGPSSVDARGQLVITRAEGVEAATQEDLESVAAQLIASDKMANTDISWQSDVNPYHGHQDVVELVDRDLGYAGRVQHVSWELDPFARVMTHTARGVEGGLA